MIDCRAHMLGRLASIIAKELLAGQHIVRARAARASHASARRTLAENRGLRSAAAGGLGTFRLLRAAVRCAHGAPPRPSCAACAARRSAARAAVGEATAGGA